MVDYKRMKKILVVEDDRSIRESILDLLQAEGFEVIAAENGTIGIQRAQEWLPDLILCDVVMPYMDGYQVLERLRCNSTTAAIPLIFLTAMGAKEDIRQGMELGADDYLSKPCTAEELMKAIATRFEKQSLLTHQSQQRLDSLRNSIALSLPHELRTPLNGILGLSELLISEHERIERQEVLEIAESIHASAERLHRLIQNFLLYAELEIAIQSGSRGRPHRSQTTCLPCDVLREISTQIARRYGRDGDLTLMLEDACIPIPDLRFGKIVEELVDNAFKFSKPGTTVGLTTTVEEREFILSIKNQGRGMTAEQIANQGAYLQFERSFYEQQGSGLGLEIARRLTALYQGELVIESAPGESITVRVVLPVQPQE
jgi:CheY-like chemotaxis protein